MSYYTPDSTRQAQADQDLLFDCPSCGLPAEITDRFTLNGAPAPVEHAKLVCIQRHWYTLPLDQLVLRAPEPDRVDSSQVAP